MSSISFALVARARWCCSGWRAECGPAGGGRAKNCVEEGGFPKRLYRIRLDNALGSTSANSNGVTLIAYSPSDPPTAAGWQVLADKMNGLITALRR